MARSLSSSRAYLAAATSTSSSSISFRRLALRSNSNIPNTPAADPAAADEPSTDPLVRQFEDAVHRIIVRRAAPDWLPFLPGSSYWVPSARSSAGSFGIAHLIQNLANPMTHEEAFSVTTVRGWPSSNYFIKGIVREFDISLDLLLHPPYVSRVRVFILCEFLSELRIDLFGDDYEAAFFVSCAMY
ncbi:hypothetical protein LINPERPRIM_LOCUS26699 [Linum perenne]